MDFIGFDLGKSLQPSLHYHLMRRASRAPHPHRPRADYQATRRPS